MSDESKIAGADVLARLLEEKKSENLRLRSDLAELRQAATRLRNRFNDILHNSSCGNVSAESVATLELYARIEQLERERLELAAALENSDDRNTLALARIRSLEDEKKLAEQRAASVPEAAAIVTALSDSLHEMFKLVRVIDLSTNEYNRLLHDIESEKERSAEIEAQLERKSQIAAVLAERVEQAEANVRQFDEGRNAAEDELRELCEKLRAEILEKEARLLERDAELENVILQMNMLDQRLADQEELIEQSQKELASRRQAVEVAEAGRMELRRRVEEAAGALADERLEKERLLTLLEKSESQFNESRIKLENLSRETTALRESLALRDRNLISAEEKQAALLTELENSADNLMKLESEKSELTLELQRLEELKLSAGSSDLWSLKLRLVEEREKYVRAGQVLQSEMRALKLENEVLNRQLLRKIEELSEVAAESAELRSRLEYFDLLERERKA